MALMEVIESSLNRSGDIIERVPAEGGGELKWGAQLTVRDGQWAVFYRDGKALTAFEAGRHILTTQNIPILTKFVTQFGYGKDSPFRADVVYVSKKLFPDLRWGTSEPIVFRDPELKYMRLRAYGTQTIRVKDPLIFLNNLVGSQGAYTTASISSYLRLLVTSKLVEVLGSKTKSIFDLAAEYGAIAAMVKTASIDSFEGLGLELVDFIVNSISPPKTVQEIIDRKAAMSVIGDMNQYMQYQTATALGDAANNPGGAASGGVGLGAGLGLGMILPQSIMNSFGKSISSNQDNSASSEPLAEKLKLLKSLKDQDLLSDEEYLSKREKLLSQI